MKNSSSNGKMMGALLLGTIVGGAIGVLFAPDEGKNTRNKLMRKGNKLTDEAEEKFDDFVDDAKKEMKMVQNKTNEFADKSRNELNKLT